MAVYKDKIRNTWYFRIYVSEKSGVRKQKSRSGFRTKGEAKKAENDFIINYSNSCDNVLFYELYKVYITHKEQELKYQSYRSIKNRFENHILPFFYNYKINNITAKDYIEWKEYIIKKDYSFKYNSSLHICMVNILNFACSFYNLNENIASKVGNFSKRNYYPQVNYWTYEEFLKFISCVDDIIYYSLFTVLYFTGMRIGECLALNWNDIYDDYIDINKTLIRGNTNNPSFNPPKTNGSLRHIKIDNNVKSVFNDLKAYYKDFVSFNNNWFVFGGFKPLATTTIDNKKDFYSKKANVKHIRIHDFRHSHATLLLSKGIPITVISRRLGHSDVTTTLNIYSHFVPQDEDKAIDILNNLKK